MDQDTCEDPVTSSAEDESESESSEAEDSLKNGNLVAHSNVIKFVEIPSWLCSTGRTGRYPAWWAARDQTETGNKEIWLHDEEIAARQGNEEL